MFAVSIIVNDFWFREISGLSLFWQFNLVQEKYLVLQVGGSREGFHRECYKCSFFSKIENYVVQFYAWCSFLFSFVLMYGNILQCM